MIKTIKINSDDYMCIMCTKNGKKNKNSYVPQNGEFWSNEKIFTSKLVALENFLIKTKKYKKNSTITKCELCKWNDDLNYMFYYKKMAWNSDLLHYVYTHHIKPPSKFISFIFNSDPENKFNCQNKILNKFSYVKIKTNQLLILDALMEHGGILQKYQERHMTGYRYSEHSGILVFEEGKLDRVIISGSTERTTVSDPDIFFPNLGDMAYEYEYIFHTHPPTPKPGGRVGGGIMYELPSSNDIYHFIEHFNYGKLQGSIVLAPEGLYNIRKNIFDKQKITVENNFGSLYKTICSSLQHESIEKFGIKFSVEYFYKIISHDTDVINRCNKFLEKYDLHIDFYPRQLTKTGNWIIGTIYLPLCSPKRK